MKTHPNFRILISLHFMRYLIESKGACERKLMVISAVADLCVLDAVGQQGGGARDAGRLPQHHLLAREPAGD